jgi:hypothetical protein
LAYKTHKERNPIRHRPHIEATALAALGEQPTPKSLLIRAS